MVELREEHSIVKRQKREYFIGLGLEMRSALKLHKAVGLWDRALEGKRDWGNVSEHCLVEAARAEVFADLLGFPHDLKKDLKIAAALHDYFKKREKQIAREGDNTENAFAKAEAESLRLLTEAGFSKRVIYLASSTGSVESIKIETPRLLGKPQLSEDEIAYLVLHYIDDYTIGNDWVMPVEALPDGRIVNAFDRRMNDLDIRYPELKAEGFTDFQRNIGHQVEGKLAKLIQKRTGREIDPKLLPELIDLKIKNRITSTTLSP